MSTNRKPLDRRNRQNLRLDPDVWEAIDAACKRHRGYVARNTWITEAILDKLERERVGQKPGVAGGQNV